DLAADFMSAPAAASTFAAHPGRRAGDRDDANSERQRHLGREPAWRRHVELRIADFALGHEVAIVAEIAARNGEPRAPGLERRPRIDLAERLREEAVAAIERPRRLVPNRDPAADARRRRVRGAKIPQEPRFELDQIAADVAER